MFQARRISYDEVMAKVLPIAQRQLSKSDVTKPNSDIKTDQKPINLDNIAKKIKGLIDDIDSVKKSEKDSDKLNVLHDAALFVGFHQWGLNLTQQSAPSKVLSTFTCLLWAMAPTILAGDNRLPNILAKDILAKAEIVNEKQNKPSSDLNVAPVIELTPVKYKP